MRVPLPIVIAIALLAGAAGWLLHPVSQEPKPEPARPEAGPAVPVESSQARPAEPSGKPPPAEGDPRAGSGPRREELQEENRRLRERIAALEKRILEHDAENTVTLEQVLAGIDSLKGHGLKAFLAPGATAELVSNLKKLGSQGLDAVVSLLDSENPDERLLAAKLLEDLGDPRSISALERAALEDDTEMVANMASHALALMGSPDALASLRRLVNEGPYEGARVNSLFGLCKLGDADGIRQTLDYLRDAGHGSEIKAALGAGVFILGDPRVMAIADEAVSQFRSSEHMMQLAVGYYKSAGTPEARSRLQDIAADNGYPQAIRDAALQALQQ